LVGSVLTSLEVPPPPPILRKFFQTRELGGDLVFLGSQWGGEVCVDRVVWREVFVKFRGVHGNVRNGILCEW
jgi:hypothetical protein